MKNLTRAAIVYLGAVLATGCSSDPKYSGTETVVQPYGAPPEPPPEVPVVEDPPADPESEVVDENPDEPEPTEATPPTGRM